MSCCKNWLILILNWKSGSVIVVWCLVLIWVLDFCLVMWWCLKCVMMSVGLCWLIFLVFLVYSYFCWGLFLSNWWWKSLGDISSCFLIFLIIDWLIWFIVFGVNIVIMYVFSLVCRMCFLYSCLCWWGWVILIFVVKCWLIGVKCWFMWVCWLDVVVCYKLWLGLLFIVLIYWMFLFVSGLDVGYWLIGVSNWCWVSRMCGWGWIWWLVSLLLIVVENLLFVLNGYFVVVLLIFCFLVKSISYFVSWWSLFCVNRWCMILSWWWMNEKCCCFVWILDRILFLVGFCFLVKM